MKLTAKTVRNFYSSNKPLTIMLAVLFALLTLFFAKAVLATLELVVLLIIASMSTSYRAKIGFPYLGFELVTFCTVLVGLAYNPLIGGLFGLTVTLASEVIAKSIGPPTWIYAIVMTIIGATVGNFEGTNIVLLGVAVTIIKLFFTQMFYFLFGDLELKSLALLHIGTSIVFNFILFLTLGSRILSVLT